MFRGGIHDDSSWADFRRDQVLSRTECGLFLTQPDGGSLLRRRRQGVEVGFFTGGHGTTDFGAFNFATNHAADQGAFSAHKTRVIVGTLVSAVSKTRKAIEVQLALKARVFSLRKEPKSIYQKKKAKVISVKRVPARSQRSREVSRNRAKAASNKHMATHLGMTTSTNSFGL